MPSKRLLNDWLSSFEKYTQNSSETAVSHLIWGGISAIAAALQRKTYIRWGQNKIFPNLYIILVGPSGSRKADAINIPRKFAERTTITLLGEDNSQESVIREMRDSASTFKDEDSGRIEIHSSVSCFLEELSVFVGQQNTQFLAYLTNWYDSRDKWRRKTKHQGEDEIMGMCFNLLAATAPDWIPYILPREAIGGGFTSRCIFVVEEGKSKIISNPNSIKEDKELDRRLTVDLEIINTLTGEFEFDKAGLQEYEEWYIRDEQGMQAGRFAIASELFAGYNTRRATHLKKLGMIMSASRGNDLIITAKDFRRAKALLEITEKKMPRVFAGIGKARYAEETELVLGYISRCGSVTKSTLLKQFYRTLDDYSLDIVIKVLSSMKVLKVLIGTGDVTYTYTGEKREQDTPVLHIVKGGRG